MNFSKEEERIGIRYYEAFVDLILIDFCRTLNSSNQVNSNHCHPTDRSDQTRDGPDFQSNPDFSPRNTPRARKRLSVSSDHILR